MIGPLVCNPGESPSNQWFVCRNFALCNIHVLRIVHAAGSRSSGASVSSRGVSHLSKDSTFPLLVHAMILFACHRQLVVNYNIDYVNDPQSAVDFAGEAALAVGTILTVMSVLNLGKRCADSFVCLTQHLLTTCLYYCLPVSPWNAGNFIRFISHPVMSGFTTAAAMVYIFSFLLIFVFF